MDVLANNKSHWENIYISKQSDDLSWTQKVPKSSLEFIHFLRLPKTAKIIDIGGGESRLIEYLIDLGFEDLTVLDISENAINKVKARLGEQSAKVKWIVSDILDFQPEETYDLWHDRATFHFFTSGKDIAKYIEIARKSVNGYLVIATFSDKGPEKCSGLEISKYNESELEHELSLGFSKIKCVSENHITPFGTAQNFLFCSFERKDNK